MLSKYFAILSKVPGQKPKQIKKTENRKQNKKECHITNAMKKTSNINPANEKCVSVDAQGHMRSVRIYDWGNALSQMYKW